MTPWARHRLVGVDAARGVALLGMIAAHTVPRVEKDGTVSPAFALVAGRAAALFAVLAGVGLVLLTRWEPSTPVAVRTRHRVGIVVRALLLIVIGLLLAEVESGVAVILVYYGVMFVLATPFLGLGARSLAALSAAVAVLVPVVSQLVRPLLPAPSGRSPGWALVHGSPWETASELTLTGFYPALPWMAYVLAGMAVGRLRLRDRDVAAWLLAGGVALLVAARLVSWLLLAQAGGLDALRASPPRLFTLTLDQALVVGLAEIGTTPTGTWWWLAVATPHTATPFDLAATIGSALAVIGLCLLLLPRPRLWATPLVALGGMSLSAYCLHVVLLGTVLPREPYAFVSHAVVLMLGAVLWRALVGQGPLEFLTQQISRRVSRLVVPPRPADAAARA